ncbi:MAG TPA: hypothetical protein VEB19_02345 [Gemmatimonadaceae bacterium]|nr:hypothetical protein [Gemmatimonadaceae bacterium]
MEGVIRRSGVWSLGGWLVAAAVLLLVRVASNGFTLGIAHDSFQYLGAADQALQGNFGATSIVHFDAERSFGRLPAPLVTFPLGYPALLATVSLSGMPVMRAALLINMAALLSCVAIGWWLTGKLALRRGIRHAVIAAIICNGAIQQFAATASTEMTFTLLVLAAAALLLRARLAGRDPRWWIAAGLALGLSYHVRYAGLFLIVGLFGLAARHLLARRRVLVVGYGLAAATASLLVLAGIARNVLLVGNWRGGNEKAVTNSLDGVLVLTARAANGLLLGPPGTAPHLSLVLRLAFVACAVIAAVMLWRRLSSRTPTHPAEERDFTIDVVLLVGVYSAFMFYAALTTVISYGTRMFVPVLPLLAVVLGSWLSHRASPDGALGFRRAPALVAAFGLYLAANGISFGNPLVDRASVVQAQLDARTGSGNTIRQLIDATGPGVVVANHGQALGFLLARPTVSLVSPHYSNKLWDQETLQDVVNQYSAVVLVITAPSEAQPSSTDLIPSPFIDSLARGSAASWLRLAGQSGPVFVYVPMAQR